MNPWIAASIGLICGIVIGAGSLLLISIANIGSLETRREERRQAESESRQ